MIFYGHEIKIQALGYEIETTVYFWEHYRLPRNLLGRAGWINKFRLALIEHDLELYREVSAGCLDFCHKHVQTGRRNLTKQHEERRLI